MECRKEVEWFTRARFGMFCHWGLHTGGGSSRTEGNQPFVVNSVDEFEEQAPEPKVFAANLVGLTKKVEAAGFGLSPKAPVRCVSFSCFGLTVCDATRQAGRASTGRGCETCAGTRVTPRDGEQNEPPPFGSSAGQSRVVEAARRSFSHLASRSSALARASVLTSA